MTMPPPRPNKLRPVPTGKPRCGDSVAAAEPRLKRKSSPKYYRMLEDTSQPAHGPYPGRNGVVHRKQRLGAHTCNICTAPDTWHLAVFKAFRSELLTSPY